VTRDRLALFALLAGTAALTLRGPGATLAAYTAGVIGLAAMHERLRHEFGGGVALLSSAVVFLGTSLFWAMTRDTAGVDAVAFAIVAVVLLAAERPALPRLSAASAWCAAAALPVLLRYLLRQPAGTTAPPAAGWLASLFGTSQGFLSLTPVTYLALVGLLPYARRNPAWTFCTLAVIALWIPANAVIAPVPVADAPFSHGLTPALAMLAPGLAYVLDRARARPLLAAAPVVGAAIVWNYWLMVQYTVGTLPKDAPVSFAAMVRGQADAHVRPPYVYPFAFPANVWFAWREGVPVDRFERLAFEPRRESVDLVMASNADRFILDGWEEGAARESVRWIRDKRASLALPLDMPANRASDVVVTARARLEEPAMAARVALEVNGVVVGRFVVPPDAPIDVRLHVPATGIGRPWRAGYNRLTFVSDGMQRVDPVDQRPAGPLASRPGDRAWPVAIYRIRIDPSS
jgi:hypothetical protein